MRILIASDNQTTATKLRHCLAHAGFDCPIDNVVSTDRAPGVLRDADSELDLVLFVLTADAAHAIDNVRSIRDQTSAKIISVGPNDEPQRVLGCIHAGADDYLNEAGDLQDQLSASLDRLNSRRDPGAVKGRVTLIAGAGGGSGASFVACNLAVVAARNNPTCLIDFNLRGGDQACLLDLQPRHTVADLCRNVESLDRNMLEQSLVQHDSGVRVLAGSHRLSDRDAVTPERLHKIVSLARTLAPNLLVDVSAALGEECIELLPVADKIVLLFRLEFPALRIVRRALDEWQLKDLDPSRVHLVANRCGRKHEIPISKVEQVLRRKVAQQIVEDGVSVNLSVNCGSPVVIEAAGSAVAKALKELARMLELESACGTRGAPEQDAGTASFFSRVNDLTRRAFGPVLARATNS